MSNVDLEALKSALAAATQGPSAPFKMRGLSLSAGLDQDAVRDILRGKNKTPGADAIVGLARELGRDLGDFIGGPPGPSADGVELLTVTGPVAAGVWREQADWPEDERYPIEVGPSPVRGAERFALRMEGYSMDKTIPPNSDLECLRVAFGLVEPAPGDLVIVERHQHDLTEMTCKRLDREGDDWVLRCESTRPEFQEPIPIGRPDADVFTDDEVRIVGIVINAQQRHFRRR